MGVERKIAWASLLGTTALGLLMWGLAQSDFHWPWLLVYGAIAFGSIGLVVAAGFWCHIGWVWIRTKGLRLGPAIVIVLGLVTACGGLAWAIAAWKPVVSATSRPPLFEVENLLFVPAQDHRELTVVVQNNGAVTAVAPVWGVQVVIEGAQPTNSEALTTLNQMTPMIAAQLPNRRGLVEVPPGQKIMVGNQYQIPLSRWDEMVGGKTVIAHPVAAN